MNNYVLGIDPDSKAHGVAIYRDGELLDLIMMTLVEVIEYVQQHKKHREMGLSQGLLFSIEDVMVNKFLYSRNLQDNRGALAKVAMNVGHNQQAYVELTRVLDYMGVKYITHKPQKGNWAKNKKEFQLVTGWPNRSNEDTRSAAFFGFLGCK